MRFCADCEQANPDEAAFCLRCGSKFGAEGAASGAQEEEQQWRTFIGASKAILFSIKGGWSWQSADRYYLEQFRKFASATGPRFRLTWNWAAFLVPPFLWFLYRKMYMYAAVYLLGPIATILLTGLPDVALVWAIIAAATANYLYFWHVKEHLQRVRQKMGPYRAIPDEALHDAGGIQSYVIALGIVLLLLGLIAQVTLVQQLSQEGMPTQGGPAEDDTLAF